FPVIVPASSSCEVRIAFTPRGVDVRHAALSIKHDASANPTIVSLTGAVIAQPCEPPVPPAESRTIACAAGQDGSMTQSRAYACDATMWVSGPWTTINNVCRTSFPAPDLELSEYVNSLLNHYFVTADPAERLSVESGGA